MPAPPETIVDAQVEPGYAPEVADSYVEEVLPEEFNLEPGEQVPLDPRVFFLATHGNELTVEEAAKSDDYMLHDDFNSPEMLGNFSDKGTWGTEENPGIGRFFPSSNLLVAPPNTRLKGDPNRDSSKVTTTGQPGVVPGKELFRGVDFEGNPIFKVAPDAEVLESWRTDPNGPEQYHTKIKQKLLEKLLHSDDQLLVFDLHDTSEWMVESSNPGSVRRRIYGVDYEHGSDGEVTLDDEGNKKVEKLKQGFPLAVIGDLDGKASKPGFADRFKELLIEGYGHIGVSPGKVDDEGVQLWGEVLANDPYKGAAVVNTLGIDLKNDLIREGRQDLADKINVIQIEVNRSVSSILDEPGQDINSDAANIEAMVLAFAASRAVEELNSGWSAVGDDA